MDDVILCSICRERLCTAVIIDMDQKRKWGLCQGCMDTFWFWRWLRCQGRIGGETDGMDRQDCRRTASG